MRPNRGTQTRQNEIKSVEVSMTEFISYTLYQVHTDPN